MARRSAALVVAAMLALACAAMAPLPHALAQEDPGGPIDLRPPMAKSRPKLQPVDYAVPDQANLVPIKGENQPAAPWRRTAVFLRKSHPVGTVVIVESIGHAASSGCIRMLNEHVADLYDRVPVGTRVVVLR